MLASILFTDLFIASSAMLVDAAPGLVVSVGGVVVAVVVVVLVVAVFWLMSVRCFCCCRWWFHRLVRYFASEFGVLVVAGPRSSSQSGQGSG